MSEEETNETSTEEETSEPTEGSDDLVNKANLAALRLEEANKRHEELLIREEKLQVRRTLAGKADAGQAPPQKLDETPQEYKDRILAGNLKENEG